MQSGRGFSYTASIAFHTLSASTVVAHVVHAHDRRAVRHRASAAARLAAQPLAGLRVP